MEILTNKDIILATRKKLCEIDERLRVLSELTNTKKDRKIKDVRYVIQNNPDAKRPEMDFVVDWNKASFGGMLSEISARTGLYRWGRESGTVLRDNNGRIYLINNEYSLFVPKENQELFGQVYEGLLNDEFVCNFLDGMSFYSFGGNNVNNHSIYVSPNLIRISGGAEAGTPSTVYYYPSKKEMILKTSRGEVLSSKELQTTLNQPLDTDDMSRYKETFLTENGTGEILIPEFSDKSGKVELYASDTKDGLNLIRRIK